MTTGMTERTWQAWARPDGRKGIRDAIVVVYLVECAHHVARRIVDKMDDPPPPQCLHLHHLHHLYHLHHSLGLL